ncbi:c-type cytochrome [Phenylobacterium immobile]|uniref:c-type cytochrome n=1 Tax=Phenylobacterium immobile TaxID=21 RepID=UPI000B1DF8B4|nr:cytochrome c [Phenylobacterium immobile]
MNKMRAIWTGLALVAGIATAAPAALAQSAAAKAATARKENFKQVGATFKAIRDEMAKGSPDPAVIKAGAQKLNGLARQLPGWFPRGSGAEAGVKTGAKPGVWTDAAGFAAAVRGFQGETTRFQQLAMAGDMDAAKGQIRALGGACKTCHDKYRVPET